MNELFIRILGALAFILIGILITVAYLQFDYIKTYDGLRIGGNYTHERALSEAYGYDSGGDWVCANVRGMSYDRCIDVCRHECGHEIFAEIIEKHPEMINKVMGVLNES